MAMDSMKAKLKRRFSVKDDKGTENENFDDDDYDSGDEYTTGLVHKDSDYAEKHGHDTGRPGSFLSRLIAHGNKKTEEQLAKEDEERMKRESGLMARQEAHQRGETASAGRVQN